MTAKYVLATLLLAAGCGGGDTCTATTACAGGGGESYRFCNSGASNCYYKTGDGHQYHCVTCDDCTEAKGAVEAWCAAAPAKGGGGSVGSNCSTAVTCPNGTGSYQACNSGTATGCGFKTSDGAVYSCNSCTDCTAAATQAGSWCQGGGGVVDMAGTSTGSCDLVAQGCGAGHKCVGQIDSSGNVTGSCMGDGTVAEGGSCTPGTDTSVLNDNCKAGSYCSNLFNDAPAVCRKLCQVDSDCTTGGQRCADLLSAETGTVVGVGFCVKTCTPFVSAVGNCPNGSDCGASWYDVDQTGATSTSGPGFFYCKPTGSGAVDATCSGDRDCAAFLYCGFFDQNSSTGVCTKNCDSTPAHSTCPSPAAGGSPSCVSFSDLPNGEGFCTVM